MSTVITLTDHRAAWHAESAAYLRDLADRVEAGEVPEIVVVYSDRVENGFASWGDFEDRWRLLGALEYAKAGVHGN